MADRPQRVLVTGGTGVLGPGVVRQLLEAGCAVRVLSRTPVRPGALPSGVECVVGDVADTGAVAAAVQGMDGVVHLAALLHVTNPPAELEPEYERVNVLGTRVVCDAAMQAGVRRLVYASTITVYGADREAIRESDEPRPATSYAATKLAGERIALAGRNMEGAGLAAVLRFAAIYGPSMKGNYLRLLRTLERGRYVRIGSGRNRRTLVYETDAAAAVVLALTHPAAGGQVFNVTDGATPTMNEIVEMMCAALGRRSPRLAAPAGPVRVAAGVVERGARMIGRRAPITRDAVDRLCEDVAVDGGQFAATVGFRAKVAQGEGWRLTVEALGGRENL